MCDRVILLTEKAKAMKYFQKRKGVVWVAGIHFRNFEKGTKLRASAKK